MGRRDDIIKQKNIVEKLITLYAPFFSSVLFNVVATTAAPASVPMKWNRLRVSKYANFRPKNCYFCGKAF